MELVDRIARHVRNIPDFPRPGVQFKDITPVLAHAEILQGAVELLMAPFRDAGVTKVVAIEARGFILGGILADRFTAGFIPVRKRGKLPYQAFEESYQLEYGSDSVEMHVDAIQSGDRVLIHDDVIATGGTAAASHALIQRAGGTVVGCSFLLELEFLRGRERLNGLAPIHSVLRY